MFGFKRKKRSSPSSDSVSSGADGDTTEEKPRPLQIWFATQFVPLSMNKQRQQLIGALISDKAQQFLTHMWNTLGPKMVNRRDTFPPDGLKSHVYKHNDFFFAALTFPPPRAQTEAHFGILTVGPAAGEELTPKELLEDAPYGYFVLFRDARATTRIFAYANEQFSDVGAGPKPELPLFIEWVQNVLFPAESVVTTEGSVPGMDEAMQLARDQLSGILTRFDAHEFRDEKFSLKVRVPTDVGHEYFWLVDVSHVDGMVSGVVDGAPKHAASIKQGERWNGPVNEVVDWILFRDDQLYGNHTLRALLPTMPETTASKWAHAMSEHSDPPPIKD